MQRRFSIRKMNISERQLKLIQGAAGQLVDVLRLTKEEAVKLIAMALQAELVKRKTNLEELNLRPRSERASFIRGVVQQVHESLIRRNEWSKTLIDQTIQSFMEILHDSYMEEMES